ncbi:glycosyltransferase [Colwelliaceae bacterium MEBiC 14330]
MALFKEKTLSVGGSREEMANVDSSEEMTNVDSTEEMTNIDSTEEMANVDSSEEMANVDSTEEMTNVDSTEEMVNVDSTEEMANVDSTEEMTNVDSSEEMTNVDSSEVMVNVDSTEEMKSIRLILESELFDLEYYQQQAGKKFNSLTNAVEHFLNIGINDGLDPSILFSSNYYLKKYQDVRDAKVNPLVHYIEFGSNELREPSAVFKPSFYLSQLTADEYTLAKQNPLAHYNSNQKLAKPCALFDPEYYLTQVDQEVDTPLSHYLSIGYKLGFNPHPLFDSKYFIICNGVVNNRAPLVIYSEFPTQENHHVHPLFDPIFYTQRYPEVLTSGIDALSHYILIGSGSHFWPMPIFWPDYYQKQLSKNDSCFDSLLTHYVQKGESDSVSPCPWFDINFYKESYKFTKQDERGVLAHYYYDGWKHDFMPSEKFSPKFIKSRYSIAADINPLVYYLHHISGQPTLPQKAWHDSLTEYEQLEVVKGYFAKNKTKNPVVSVIVPVYNFYSYTLRCLYSIAISKDSTPCEVIIADDLSQDETQSVLGNIDGINYIRNLSNLGFLKSCNNAALSAKGEFIYLLNNDTAVLNGWLDNLVNTYAENANVGLVGSQLLYPNGLLQEAGGVLWSDGAANYGKFDDPRRPEYSYLRNVDYVSGAAIMVPTKVWQSIKGFDERYAPAYCEDSDLCLQLRNMGYQVLMQPTSKVVHFEGISSGTDLNSGVKKYQVTNSQKLKDKWSNLLSSNGLAGDFSRECINRNKGARILIIDATIPTPDQDAGSVTVWYFLKLFKELGYQVTFIPENLYDLSPYTEMVQGLGVECLYRPYLNSIEDYIQENGDKFDTVMLYRVNVGGRFYETTRKFAPNAKIIFDTVDLHFLREERQAKMEKDKEKSAQMLASAYQTRDRELFLLRNSDISIVLSEYEKDMLARDWGVQNTFVIPIVLEVPGSKTSYEHRKNIAFIGGYQHTPNVDAVLYFVENIWPKVKERINGVKFYIIGSKPTAEILALPESDEDIIVTGFIESLDPYLDNLRLTLAPLRYGAGIKGKIGSSLSYGVPCIATKVAAEGMGLVDGENILMSDDENSFVENLVNTYKDNKKWDDLSEKGLEFVGENYSTEATKKKLLALMNSVGASPFTQHSPFTGKDEVMRLVSKPHTNNFLCESNKTTVTQRLLANEVIKLAQKYKPEIKTFSDAVAEMAAQEIGINFSGAKPLITHSKADVESDSVSKIIGLIEADFNEISSLKQFEAKVIEFKTKSATSLIVAVGGEQVSDNEREDFLLMLEEYSRHHDLKYAVNAHSSSYPEQKHVCFSMQII